MEDIKIKTFVTDRTKLNKLSVSELIQLNSFVIDRASFHYEGGLLDSAKYFREISDILYPEIYHRINEIFIKNA